MSKDAAPLPASAGATPSRRPTAHDVARLAGVSQPVVSRAFSPNATISAEARAKVLAAARELGYRPNLIARSLITRRSQLIGVSMAQMDNQFYPAILQRIAARLQQAGYGLLLFPPRPGAPSEAEPLLEEVLRAQVDAVILCSATISSRFAAECARVGVPVVLVNRRIDDPTVSSVTGANRRGGREVARFLAETGHRRVAFMAGLEDSSTSREREAGFREGLQGADLPAPLRACGDYDFARAAAAAADLLSDPAPPDAIFCANDHMALAALQTARDRFGLHPGRHLSIVGFDDIPLASWPAFDLTTFSQPIEALADRAVAVALRHLDEPGSAPVHEVVPGSLIVRGSTRRRHAGTA